MASPTKRRAGAGAGRRPVGSSGEHTLTWLAERKPEESLRLRLQQQHERNCGGSTALGPADLCHLTWQTQNTGLLRSLVQTTTTEYCFAYGVDTSDKETIAAYVHSMVGKRKFEDQDFSNRLVRGVYCCTNAFAKADVWVEVTPPNTVKSFVHDKAGNRVDVPAEQWEELRVSAVLRALEALRGRSVNDQSHTLVYDPLPTPSTEAIFLQRVASVFWRCFKLGSPDGPGRPGTPSYNHMTIGLLRHFLARRQYRKAECFFARYLPHDPGFASIISCALRLQNTPESRARGICILSRAVTRLQHEQPDAHSTLSRLLLEQGRILLAELDVHAATATAQLAVRLHPSNVEACLALGRAYQHAGKPRLSLAALNLIDAPAPAVPTSGGSASQRGAKVPFQNDRDLHQLPGAQLGGVHAKAYKIMVQLCRACSWAELQAHLSAVFLAESPGTCGAGSQPAPSRPQPSAEGRAPRRTHSFGRAEKPAAAPPTPAASAIVSRPLQATPSAEGDVAIHQRPCKPWLTALFAVLHDDLCFFAHHVKARGATAKRFTGPDWYRVAQLCERLEEHGHANTAYVQCMQLAKPKMALSAALARAGNEAAKGAVSDALGAICEALERTDVYANLFAGAYSFEQVTQHMNELVAQHGLPSVHSACKSLKPTGQRRLLLLLLKRAKGWGVHGPDPAPP